MIPKIIHFCWFGGNPLPKSAIKCINSWRKYLPDYEIWQWSEDSLTSNLSTLTSNGIAVKIMRFDVNIIPYTKDAYESKKYAFVSDYVRFWILEQYGGIYFDTDVEVIKDMTPIINAGPYMGCELQDGTVNPGLGLGAEPHMPVYKQILANYLRMNFLNFDGTRNNFSMIPMVTEMLRKQGLREANNIQKVMGLNIYPTEYFNPYDFLIGKLRITENTYSIHWYDASWRKKKNPIMLWIKRHIRRIIKTLYH